MNSKCITWRLNGRMVFALKRSLKVPKGLFIESKKDLVTNRHFRMKNTHNEFRIEQSMLIRLSHVASLLLDSYSNHKKWIDKIFGGRLNKPGQNCVLHEGNVVPSEVYWMHFWVGLVSRWGMRHLQKILNFSSSWYQSQNGSGIRDGTNIIH